MYTLTIDIHGKQYYNNTCKAGTQAPYERREDMDEMANATEYLLKAILEIIDKSKTVEEIREAVKKILEGK